MIDFPAHLTTTQAVNMSSFPSRYSQMRPSNTLSHPRSLSLSPPPSLLSPSRAHARTRHAVVGYSVACRTLLYRHANGWRDMLFVEAPLDLGTEQRLDARPRARSP